MFVRFVVRSRHQVSHCRTGIFYAACGLYDSGCLNADEQQQCDEILGWFTHHLPFPNRFSRSRRRDACRKAVCWFKDSAVRHIRKVRELAGMLEQHSIPVELLRTIRPGYIVYKDAYQIVAVPFRGARA